MREEEAELANIAQNAGLISPISGLSIWPVIHTYATLIVRHVSDIGPLAPPPALDLHVIYTGLLGSEFAAARYASLASLARGWEKLAIERTPLASFMPRRISF